MGHALAGCAIAGAGLLAACLETSKPETERRNATVNRN